MVFSRQLTLQRQWMIKVQAKSIIEMITVTAESSSLSISKDSCKTKVTWTGSESYINNRRQRLPVSKSKVVLKRWLKTKRVVYKVVRLGDIHPNILPTILTAIARERRQKIMITLTLTTLEILHLFNRLFQTNLSLVSTSFSTVLLQTSTINQNLTLMKMSLNSTIRPRTSMRMTKVKMKNNLAIRVQITLQMRKNASVWRKLIRLTRGQSKKRSCCVESFATQMPKHL